MGRRLALVLALGACGRVGFDPVRDDGGPMVDDARTADAMPASCMNFGDWGSPSVLAPVASASDDRGGEVTADGLGFYFNSNRDGAERFYVARRVNRTAAWQASQVIAELDGEELRTDITVSGDELEVFFTATPGAVDCIYRASRASRSQPFSTATPQSALCGAAQSQCPHVSSDGLTLVYSSAGVLMISTRANRDAAFPAGTVIPGLYTGIGCPYLTDDQLALYYEAAAAEIQFTTRATTSVMFPQPPQTLPSIAAAGATNEDVSLTRDGLELFFDSDRPGIGLHDPYVVSRPCLD